MFSKWVLSAIAVFAIGTLTVCAADAGERKPANRGGGPVQEILDNAKELNLTAEQKTKLEALQKEVSVARDPAAMREKFKDNPEMLGVMKEMKAARESGDEAKLKELREKIRAKSGPEAGAKPGEGPKGEIVQKLAQILSREQMLQVREIRQKDGGPKLGDGRLGGKAAPEEKRGKPDASTGVPDPFEK